MGSVPNTLTNTETLPVIAYSLPQDSHNFLEKVTNCKYHSSVVDLKQAADETRLQVKKALNLVHNNLLTLNNNRSRFQCRSINMIEVQKKKRRVITQIQQKKQIYTSVVVKPKLPLKYPQIKTNKKPLAKNIYKSVKRQKMSSAFSIIYVNKK